MAAFLNLEDMDQVYDLAVERLNDTTGELTLGNFFLPFGSLFVYND